MNFTDYITEQVLYLIPALVFVGWCIKRIPNVPNWVIPFALIVIGVVASGCILGFDAEGIIQGVLCAGAAVLGNQLWKQLNEAANSDDKEE